jgi:hypothetical protein
MKNSNVTLENFKGFIGKVLVSEVLESVDYLRCKLLSDINTLKSEFGLEKKDLRKLKYEQLVPVLNDYMDKVRPDFMKKIEENLDKLPLEDRDRISSSMAGVEEYADLEINYFKSELERKNYRIAEKLLNLRLNRIRFKIEENKSKSKNAYVSVYIKGKKINDLKKKIDDAISCYGDEKIRSDLAAIADRVCLLKTDCVVNNFSNLKNVFKEIDNYSSSLENKVIDTYRKK